MPSSLAARLEGARRHHFVGRQRERALFRSAVEADQLPFSVIYVFGPGGVGKTSLLREFSTIASRQNVSTVYLDGRNVDATPHFFLGALQKHLPAKQGEDVVSYLTSQKQRWVILVDSAEYLTPLNRWLRNEFLPQLPDDVLVILAGRRPPSVRWQADPGWQTVMRTIPLRNLTAEESRAYLVRRQIPTVFHSQVLDFTHGHPLALSLVADVITQHPEIDFRPQDAPDVVRVLVDQFVEEVSDPSMRQALEACALVRLTTEPLLAELLQVVDSYPYFKWLRNLSFVEAEAEGLFPHDLTREALIADLRWRNPEWYAELHRRARQYYMARLQQGNPRGQRHILADFIYLHRENPAVRSYFEWQFSGEVYTDSFTSEDETDIVTMVEAHEGEESARLARYWLSHPATHTSVFRRAAGKPYGFLLQLPLERLDPADRAADPAAQAAWSYLADRAPLRKGDSATLFRFWMGRDTYQAVSPVQSRIFLNMVQHYLTTPGLAFTLIPCADPDFWTDVFNYADLKRIPTADFAIGGVHYGVYGHDWRAVPPTAWLALLAEREIGASPTAATTQAEPLLVLSEADFAAAVRQALRDFTDLATLQQSPLMRSRLVVELSGPESDRAKRAKMLQALLRESAELLQASPRQLKFYRALYHTYMQPAPNQERAAELLDLPFGTYRRHLRAGIDHLTHQLWAREIS